MYRVKIFNGPSDDGLTIHHHWVNGLKIDGSIKQLINAIDTFDFSIFLDNPGYGRITPFKTLIEVRNMITGEYEFEGRVLSPMEDMGADGIVSKSFLCEGELGYLHDAPQKHLEFRGTPKLLMQTILAYFNSQVEEYKHFQLGEMNVTNSTDYMYVYLSAEKSTYDEIKDKFLDRLGGEIQIRKENGVRYLDYLQRIGEDTDTEIRLSKNLVSISKEVDPTEIITRLTPLGIRVQSEDDESTDASEARLTIESVNAGIPYIDRADLIAEFGIQGKSIVWDEVTIPNNLKTTGTNYLNNQKVVLNQYKLDALDLSLIGIDPISLKVGNGYPTINELMAIDEMLRMIAKTIDINVPEKSTYTIGDKFKTLSEYQKEANLSASRVTELQNTVDRQSRLISTLNGSVTNVNAIVDTINIQIGQADLPALNASIESLNGAIVDLNDVIESIPAYGLATETYSGLMAMDDKRKMNLITVNQVTDLDLLQQTISDLDARVQALEVEEPVEPEEGI